MKAKASAMETVCPLLGLAGDRWTRFEFPDRAHRCWAKEDRPVQIELTFQGVICARSDFHDCVVHRQWVQSKIPAEEPNAGIDGSAAPEALPEWGVTVRNGLTAATEHV
jgi:hypothetical protein